MIWMVPVFASVLGEKEPVVEGNLWQPSLLGTPFILLRSLYNVTWFLVILWLRNFPPLPIFPSINAAKSSNLNQFSYLLVFIYCVSLSQKKKEEYIYRHTPTEYEQNEHLQYCIGLHWLCHEPWAMFMRSNNIFQLLLWLFYL